MAKMNMKHYCLFGLIGLVLLVLDIRVLANNGPDASFPDKAEKPRMYYCRDCELSPGQWGIEYICFDGYVETCFTLHCQGGTCG